MVAELTDDPALSKAEQHRHQVEHAPQLSEQAKCVKLADEASPRPLRKARVRREMRWALEADFDQYASGGGRVFEIEGRLRDHEYVNGGYQDYIVSSVWRSSWREHHQRILGTAPPF